MTMSQQDKERLLQALQDDPEFLAQVRNLVLSAELVQLPERFAQFAAHVTAFIERQEEFNARQEEFNADFRAFIQRQEEFNADFRAFIQRQEETNAQQKGFNDRVEERLQRITDDLGVLKGHVAGRIAREMSDDIAERLGYEITQQLNGNDLRAMLRGSNPFDIPSSVRRSFYVADLVAKVQDQDGNQLFMAVEASYTADERDTRRAVRNAELISRFTGMTAVPVVASLENDYAVQQLVDDGQVQWFQFQTQDLQPQ